MQVTCMFLKNGEKGDNAYVHIMYADDENGKNMSSNPNGPTYTDNSSIALKILVIIFGDY